MKGLKFLAFLLGLFTLLFVVSSFDQSGPSNEASEPADELLRSLVVNSMAKEGDTFEFLLVVEDFSKVDKELLPYVNWHDEKTGLFSLSLPHSERGLLSRINGLTGASTVTTASVPETRDSRIMAYDHIAQSVSENHGVLGVSSFRNAVNAEDLTSDGSGIVIAVIDTGIDPGHPDLSMTPSDERKIIDWQDFTGRGSPESRAKREAGTYLAEGDVLTNLIVSADSRGFVTVNDERLKVGSIYSASGTYRLGVFRESQLDVDGYIGQDIDHDGKRNSTYWVLVVDSIQPGVYDTVYIDLNRNGDFTDEQPMREFKHEGHVGWFGTDNPRTRIEEQTAFVITTIVPDGSLVNVGFDGNGHGTHVAGIAGANGQDGYGLQGIAPGVQFMSLKALGSSGQGSWEDISQAMIYAAQNGADIISISVGGNKDISRTNSAESQLIRRIALEYDVLIVLAAGNEGPGIGSALTPGDPSLALTVGAYVSPGNWWVDYGWSVPSETLWTFSGVGPRQDGSLVPNVIAPGSAVSTVPLWDSATGYELMEGTSMAVPHVAGSAALLWGSAKEKEMGVTAQHIKRAIEQGARDLPGLSRVEQGHGLVSVIDSWELLSYFDRLPSTGQVGALTTEFTRYDYQGKSSGVYGRNWTPGQLTMSLRNVGFRETTMELSSDEPWLSLDTNRVTVPRRSSSGQAGSRNIVVEYDVPRGAGIYTSLVTGNDPSTFGEDLHVLHTLINPYKVGLPGSLHFTGNLPAGQTNRYLFEVPEGTTFLEVDLGVITDSAAQGRLWLHIFRPDGQRVFSDGWIGQADGTEVLNKKHQIALPEPGVWEVVVYSSAALSAFNLNTSDYYLDIHVGGVQWHPDSWTISRTGTDNDEIVQSFVIANQTKSDIIGEVIAAGFSGEPALRESRLLSLDAAKPAYYEFEVPADTLYMEVSAGNIDREADIHLYLYQWDDNTGSLKEIKRFFAAAGHDAILSLESPNPGRYVAWVEGPNMVGTANFELSLLFLQGSDSILVNTTEVHLQAGAEKSILVRLNSQGLLETEYGYIGFKDKETGRILSILPVTIQQEKPELLVQVRAEEALLGQTNMVTILVHDATTLKPVDTTLSINGRIYEVKNGYLTFGWKPRSLNDRLEIVSVDDSYQQYRRTIQIPVVLESYSEYEWQEPVPASKEFRKILEKLTR